MFTDGLSEAVDGEGKEFGEERLAELSRCARHLPAEALRRDLLNVSRSSAPEDSTTMPPSLLLRFQRMTTIPLLCDQHSP